jgi:hypothetical protein
MNYEWSKLIPKTKKKNSKQERVGETTLVDISQLRETKRTDRHPKILGISRYTQMYTSEWTVWTDQKLGGNLI